MISKKEGCVYRENEIEGFRQCSVRVDLKVPCGALVPQASCVSGSMGRWKLSEQKAREANCLLSKKTLSSASVIGIGHYLAQSAALIGRKYPCIELSFRLLSYRGGCALQHCPGIDFEKAYAYKVFKRSISQFPLFELMSAKLFITDVLALSKTVFVRETVAGLGTSLQIPNTSLF